MDWSVPSKQQLKCAAAAADDDIACMTTMRKESAHGRARPAWCSHAMMLNDNWYYKLCRRWENNPFPYRCDRAAIVAARPHTSSAPSHALAFITSAPPAGWQTKHYHSTAVRSLWIKFTCIHVVRERARANANTLPNFVTVMYGWKRGRGDGRVCVCVCFYRLRYHSD